MKALVLAAIFIGALLLPSELSGQAPNDTVHSTALGFSYTVPTGWQRVDAQTTTPGVNWQAAQSATSTEEKEDVACMEIPFMARRANPDGVIIVVALPFACYGRPIQPADLPGFATGAAEGLEEQFEITDPIYATYSLAGHKFWIERARGTPNGHTAPIYAVEVTCAVLKRAAVCWMARAVDAAGLRAFERDAVKIDGDSAPALVPTGVFSPRPINSFY